MVANPLELSPKIQLNRATRILSTIVLLAAFLWLGTNARFYTEALISAFFALTLVSVAVIHFRARPSVVDAILVLGCAVLLYNIDFQLLHFKPAIVSSLSFGGLSSLLVLGIRAIWADVEDEKLLFLAFIPSLCFVAAEYFADDFLHWTSAIHPKVFDLYLYKFDGSLHVQLPFLAGQAFLRWPNLRVIALVFYIALAIPIALVYVGRLLRIGDKAFPSFLAFLATGPIGILFYNVLPAMGPVHLFPRHFPLNVPFSINQLSRLLAEPIAGSGYPNAIPSLHMAWALLAWWYSRGLSWWERLIALLFIFFTVLATLGTGEHYFIDLIVAFPFAAFIEALFAFDLPMFERRRMTGLVFGLLATLAWLAALRYFAQVFWITPILPWALCVITVASSVLVEGRLQGPAGRKVVEAKPSTPALETIS